MKKTPIGSLSEKPAVVLYKNEGINDKNAVARTAVQLSKSFLTNKKKTIIDKKKNITGCITCTKSNVAALPNRLIIFNYFDSDTIRWFS